MDRKAMIRQYKETRRPMGIYRIRNIVSGRTLIGTSIDLPSILNRHRAQLRLGAHPSRMLQQEWKDLGPDSFVFEVLDTLTPPEDPAYDSADDLRVLETLWQEKLVASETPTYPAR
jgi:hypothetical protein